MAVALNGGIKMRYIIERTKNLPAAFRQLPDEKKCVILLVLTILMGFLLFYTYIGDRENDHEGIIRLHVIANSNTVGDQALKLKVRDAVIAYMDDQKGLSTVDETRDFLKNDLKRLETIADGIIAAEGYDYSAKANIGVRYIPEKTYGDITFPAGNYEALNITLGEGEGENWWCVLFPPLCLLDEGTDASGDLPADLTEDQSLQLRWKLIELLDRDGQTS